MGDIIYGDFEWDEAKARRNLSHHGGSFVEATTLFDDPLFVPYKDEEHSSQESRYVIIGESNENRLLVVAYTRRERTRIIGARKVTPRERRKYEESEKEF